MHTAAMNEEAKVADRILSALTTHPRETLNLRIIAPKRAHTLARVHVKPCAHSMLEVGRVGEASEKPIEGVEGDGEVLRDVGSVVDA
jgi:hypothetical protein